MARVARFIRTFGFGIFSIGLHLVLVVLCVLFATPPTDSMAADKQWIEVEMQPALGQPHGKDTGKDLGSHVPKPPAPRMPDPEPFEAPPLPPPDPDAIPTSSAEPVDGGPPREADGGDAGTESEGGASDGGEYDPTTPVGSENVPPGFGSPDGVPGGQGTAPKKISPQYMAILAAWARARFPTHGHGLGAPPEGTRPCSRVSIQISPGRQVTGSSMASSGQEVWDAKVRSALPAFSGATVPADPEGGPPPPSIGLNVCWD